MASGGGVPRTGWSMVGGQLVASKDPETQLFASSGKHTAMPPESLPVRSGLVQRQQRAPLACPDPRRPVEHLVVHRPAGRLARADPCVRPSRSCPARRAAATRWSTVPATRARTPTPPLRSRARCRCARRRRAGRPRSARRAARRGRRGCAHARARRGWTRRRAIGGSSGLRGRRVGFVATGTEREQRPRDDRQSTPAEHCAGSLGRLRVQAELAELDGHRRLEQAACR